MSTSNDDLPDLPDDFYTSRKDPVLDLHLGVPEVKRFDKDWWVKKYGPKPPGVAILLLDFAILLLGSICFWIIIVSWQHVFS
jgi:hypothetical protein